MRLVRARQVEWLALAIAVLALGFAADRAPSESLALLASVEALLRMPVTGALTLVATCFVLRSFHRRIAAIACAVGSTVWAGVGVLDGLARYGDAPGMSAEQVTIACVASLTLGALVEQLRSKTRLAYLASVTLLLIASAGSMLAVVAWELSYTTDTLLSATMPALAAAVLGIVGLGQLFRSHPTPLDTAVRRLFGPIAITGIVCAVLVGELITRHSTTSSARQIAWMVAASMLLLCLTLTAFTIVKLFAEVAAARRSTTKWQRLLRRQRGIMHERTAALRRSKAQYEDLFATVPAPVLITNRAGNVLAANPAMLALLGAESEAQLKTTNMASLHADPEGRQKLLAAWTASTETIHQGEFKLRRLDGEQRSALFTSHVVRVPRTGEIDHIQGTFTDISELRRAEANQRRLEGHLRLSQKLESVGRLAAGIAHEINTPMQYIGDNLFFIRESYESLRTLLERQRQLLADTVGRSATELAKEMRELESDADVEGILNEMPGALLRTDDGIKSVNRIVAAMKELAHPGEGAKASTDVNAVINTAVTITRNAHKTVAKVELDLGQMPNVLAYKNELCQVFINLIVNAAHAIESAKKTDNRAGAITIRTRTEPDVIRIDISDNGCGIPEAVTDKIFDPFFTTKEVGKGTGQGLALARTTIVEKHHGQLTVQSAVGQGTTFTVTLPLTNQDSTAKQETP